MPDLFVSLCSCYRVYTGNCKHSFTVVPPDKERCSFQMGTEQQQAFDKLKSCLISVLAMRIDNATYYLGTDASDTSDT